MTFGQMKKLCQELRKKWMKSAKLRAVSGIVTVESLEDAFEDQP